MAGTFGLTAEGYNLKRTTDFIAQLEADFATVFPGANTAPESNLGQIIGVLASFLAERDEQTHASYTNMQLGTAEGVNLDQLGSLVGLPRAFDTTTNANETDASYRARLLAISLANATPDNATSNLCRTLKAIAGVEYVAINTGVGSYEVVILGGDDSLIAESIYAFHPTGATMTGNTEYDVTSDCGFCQRVSFTRPTAVDVCIRLEIAPVPGCDCDSSSVSPFETAIFNHLTDSGAACNSVIGATLQEGHFYTPLLTVGEVTVTNFEFSRDGGATYAPGPLVLANEEYAVYSRDCTEVTFQ